MGRDGEGRVREKGLLVCTGCTIGLFPGCVVWDEVVICRWIVLKVDVGLYIAQERRPISAERHRVCLIGPGHVPPEMRAVVDAHATHLVTFRDGLLVGPSIG